jgi:hypothetical protein
VLLSVELCVGAAGAGSWPWEHDSRVRVTPVPAPPLRPTRRTALGALAGAIAGAGVLSGCDLDDLGPGGPDPTPGAGGEAEVDADQGVVDDAVADLARTAALLTATRTRFPRLRARVAPLHALHLAHLETLGGAPDDAGDAGGAPATPAVPGSARAAWSEVRTLESRLQRRLADWSVAARSGDLARVLASMSAAVAQELAAGASAPPEEAGA